MDYQYLNAIPQLATWKILSNTIQTMHNLPNTDKDFQRLSRVVEKPELSAMFAIEIPNLPYDEHIMLLEKHKQFTMWVLGQFFYLSTLPYFKRVQTSLVKAQNRILYRVYIIKYDLYDEYIKVLDQLNKYAQNNYNGNVKLQTFMDNLPEDLTEMLQLTTIDIVCNNREQCIDMLEVLLDILGYAADDMLNLYHITKSTHLLMNNLLTVLKTAGIALKLVVLQIYVNCLKSNQVHPKGIEDIKNEIFALFKVLFINNETYFQCEEDIQKFEDISIKLFQILKSKEKCQEIYHFILSNSKSLQLRELAITYVENVKFSSLNYLPRFKQLVINEIQQCKTTDVYTELYQSVLNSLEFNENKTVCNLMIDLQKMEQFLAIVLCAKFETQFVLLSEAEFVQKFISYVMLHIKSCSCDVDFERFMNVMALVVAIGNSQYVKVVFEWFVFLLNKTSPVPTCDLYGVAVILTHFKSRNLQKERIFDGWCYYMVALVVGNCGSYEEFENYFLKVALAMKEETNAGCQEALLKYFVPLFSKTERIDLFENQLLQQLMTANNHGVQKSFAKILPDLFTILCMPYVRCIKFDKEKLSVILKPLKSSQKRRNECLYVHENCERILDDLQGPRLINLLKHFLRLLKEEEDNACYILAIRAMPAVARCVPDFCRIQNVKWMKPLETKDSKVKDAFVYVILHVLTAVLDNPDIEDEKDAFLKRFFDYIMAATDKALRIEDQSYMQDTIIAIVDRVSLVEHKSIELNTVRFVLYFIITLSSLVRCQALATLIGFRKRKATITRRLFSKYRPELCKIIVQICAVNKSAGKWTLAQSLETFAAEMGYSDVKQLFIEETRYFLPLFVSLCLKRPAVNEIIEEIARFNEVEVKDLFADHYGYIYVHLSLNVNEDCEDLLRFVERKSCENGITLRKNNFMVILNELLLNFYEKRDRVLSRLSILASEESGDAHTTVQEYIWPRFLGVLQYLDLKIFSTYHKKENMLHGLAAIFQFMGPKYITPVRFKIIAMLRTMLAQTEGTFPDLNCVVWEAFLHSCDLEILAPQLATVCVSMYPLIKRKAQKINDILRYLVISNLKVLNDNIVDLFFLLDLDMDVVVHQTISQHLEKVQKLDFTTHLRFFMKYLTYETIEVQWHALKYIKVLLGKNRSELEDLILGFNGIDAIIVELIEYLLKGCREPDVKIRSACGDCIGELGAIEPSLLPPPRGVEEAGDFSFSITEPMFILSSLNEFGRAMQVEANCKKMDAFALAIQETLRTYGIAPQSKTDKHGLWNNLSDAQKELMLPFVSSKYCNVSHTELMHCGPIYGSNLGSDFKCWLDSWTNKMVSSVAPQKKTLFCAYIPSMKQDMKTLMYFLPHILLNSLVDGREAYKKDLYDEFMAVIDGIDLVGDQIRKNRPIRMDTFVPNPIEQSTKPTKNCNREVYLKVVFVLFDFLERWMREYIWVRNDAQQNKEYQAVQRFLGKFCKYQLAKSNFQFRGYPRALMYLEDHIMADKGNQDECLSLLSQIYCRLNEPDGVAGVTALRKSEGSLAERILDHEAAGQIPLAAACAERLPYSLSQLQGLVKMHMQMDHTHTALHMAKSVYEAHACDWMQEAQAEAMWRLGSYDELDEYVRKQELAGSTNWGVQTGRALMHFRNGERDAFKEQLERLKMIQVDGLGASSLEEGTYQHGYYYIARIHAINELEQIADGVHELLLRPQSEQMAKAIINKMREEWEVRLKYVQQNVKVIEPILCLRRAALSIAREKVQESVKPAVGSLDALLGDTWLKSATVAMNSEFHKQAYSYFLKAEEFAPPRLFVEKAIWFWLGNEHHQALTTLKQQLRVLIPNNKTPEGFPLEMRKICAEAILLVATYNNALSNVDADVNIQSYKESIEMFRECEKSYVQLAQFYDRVFSNIADEDKDSKGSEIQIHMINYFGKSLAYGTEFIYQSMPRLLSIWFDYGTRLLEVKSPAIREERQQNLLRMTKLIDTYLERLPSYIFLTAFSQIISRICHSQKEVYKELNQIIIKLILKYPQQTLWMMISVIKSSYELRSRRCRELLSDARLKTPVMVKFLSDFIKLAEKLIDLTNKNISGNRVSLSMVSPSLSKLLAQADFSEIMIPTYKFRKLILPNPEHINTSYNPFPNHYVHIVGIEDEVTLLPSLQRPRRITLRGSDGKLYIQMLKPKDDLRKDFRLMEFNDIVNQLLSKEAASRERRLNIRLYSVAPLNEECGMIEWVPNLVGLRPTVMTIYKQRGCGMRSGAIRECCAQLTDSLEKKRNIYLNILLPKHPPVLGDWFRRTFPDAHGWLTARTAYTRTTAVMSMVGHILGLGDRHGENILLDSTCGDAVHVDFNCLFNKGEQFEWPERVPFRLTPNMVAAMGPLGVEGMFRNSCACTLGVLRTHANTLMSIVTPFVYDPLVSWPKRVVSSSTANEERTNALAVEHIKVIQRRLQGHVKSTKRMSYSISLSVEGQTDKLIAEALSVDNLCQMYIGWGPYL